jgi:hypothetical protein
MEVSIQWLLIVLVSYTLRETSPYKMQISHLLSFRTFGIYAYAIKVILFKGLNSI